MVTNSLSSDWLSNISVRFGLIKRDSEKSHNMTGKIPLLLQILAMITLTLSSKSEQKLQWTFYTNFKLLQTTWGMFQAFIESSFSWKEWSKVGKWRIHNVRSFCSKKRQKSHQSRNKLDSKFLTLQVKDDHSEAVEW